MDVPEDREPVDPHTASLTSKLAHKRIKVTMLATSVVLSLSNWDAMAHGNRSSHKSAAGFAWAPDRYVLMRQELEDPLNPDTKALRELYGRLDAAQLPGAVVDGNSLAQLRTNIKTLEDKLRLSPMSRQVFELSSRGDVPGVASILEGGGNTEAILDSYNWALLDIARRSDQGLLTTDADLPAVVTVARSARDYAARLQAEINRSGEYPDRKLMLGKLATLLHNVATMTIPDIGNASPESLAVGKDAAESALKIRQTLNEPLDIVRAKLVLGQHLSRKGETAAASRILNEARTEADRVGHKSLQAFSRAYLADVAEVRKNSALARRLRDESLRLVQGEALPAGSAMQKRTFAYERQQIAAADVRARNDRERTLNDVDWLKAYLAGK